MATAQARSKPQEVGGKFRILIGDHVDNGPSGCECDGCLSDNPLLRGKNHRYRARRYNKDGNPSDPPEWDGDIIDTKADLVRRFNRGPGSTKFERLDAQGNGRTQQLPAQPPEAFPLDKMTLAQLIGVAGDEGVDASKLRSEKSEYVKAIKQHREHKPA